MDTPGQRYVVGAEAEELGGQCDVASGMTSRIGRKGGLSLEKGAASRQKLHPSSIRSSSCEKSAPLPRKAWLAQLPVRNSTKTKTMARKTVRVEVPRDDPAALVKLSLGIVKQHTKAGTASPITDGVVKMTDYAKRANDASALQEIEELQADLQQKIGKRDQLLGLAEGQNAQTKGTTLFETLQIRDLLLAVNRGTEEALEPWGFTVTVGSAAAPVRKKKENG
jgi:hypothetical protein